MLKINEYYRIGQASEVLGISIGKLRRLDREGVLVAFKAPGSRFRMYTKEQLEDFLKSISRDRPAH